MLDSKLLRKETQKVINNLKRRSFNFDELTWSQLESKRKELQSFTEDQKSKLNEISKQIGIAKKNAKDTSHLQEEASELTNKIKELNIELDNLLKEIEDFVLAIPNLIDDDVPDGQDETSNKEIRIVGTKREFTFIPKDHLELGRNQEIDMEAGVKITGSRFLSLIHI